MILLLTLSSMVTLLRISLILYFRFMLTRLQAGGE